MKSHLLRLYHPRPRQFAYARMVREKGASPAAGGRPRLYATCTVVGIKLCDARHSRNSNCYDSTMEGGEGSFGFDGVVHRGEVTQSSSGKYLLAKSDIIPLP